jgi:hypothetical protein
LIISTSTSFNTNQAVTGDAVLSKRSLAGAFSSLGESSWQDDWKIVRVADKTFIELGKGFKATEPPDMKVFLSPLPSSNIIGDNATKNSTFIQQVSVFKGKSRVEIPADVDLERHQFLVFHCEAYSRLWASAPL